MNKKDAEPPVELECQFILRLPEEPANVLRDILRSGAATLKDRFSVRLENDVRYGEVRVDNWLLHAKVVDLPTIVESLKTIDNKSFYKTADICQMMICREEEDSAVEEESPAKKKKDPNKVDKKFLWPHGITPPLKNVRKRRFRKTLKKKYVEAPEVEKEVKRLLRGDNDAVSVKWEVISEEDDKRGIIGNLVSGSGTGAEPSEDVDVGITIKEEPIEEKYQPDTNTQTSVDVAEHDIFGEAVSDSDEEESHINIMEEESSRLSADDSRISDSTSLQMPDKIEDNGESSGLVTHFSKGMFQGGSQERDPLEDDRDPLEVDEEDYYSKLYKHSTVSLTIDEIRARLDVLQKELAEMKVERDLHEQEVANIENLALRQRFQHIWDSRLQQQLAKEQEYRELTELYNMHQEGQ